MQQLPQSCRIACRSSACEVLTHECSSWCSCLHTYHLVSSPTVWNVSYNVTEVYALLSISQGQQHVLNTYTHSCIQKIILCCMCHTRFCSVTFNNMLRQSDLLTSSKETATQATNRIELTAVIKFMPSHTQLEVTTMRDVRTSFVAPSIIARASWLCFCNQALLAALEGSMGSTTLSGAKTLCAAAISA